MRFFLISLFTLLSVNAATAQKNNDRCHVYVVDVEKTRKILEDFKTTGNSVTDAKLLAAGQTVFPEFRPVIGEEELTTKSYPFPESDLIITASVYYTDESMASSRGNDSMQLGIVVSPKAQKNALSVDGSSITEITLNDRDTVRAKKFLTVKGRLYLVDVECRCRETKSN